MGSGQGKDTKLWPEAWVLKTEGTVFPNKDQPRLVYNIFFYFRRKQGPGPATNLPAVGTNQIA